MKTKLPQTKKEVIAEKLRGEIVSGHFGDGQIPSKRDLAAHFGVSHRTIEPVLKLLQEEGLIRCVRGTGTFVNNGRDDVSNLTRNMVLMLLPENSFFESEPCNALRQEAFRRGLLPVNLPMPGKYVKLTLQEKSILTQTLKAPIRGVLYNGRGYRTDPFLDGWRNQRSVALMSFHGASEPPGSSLLLDYEAGAEKIARHLIEKGCRKLAVVTGYADPAFPRNEFFQSNLLSTQFMKGASRAARDAGLPRPALYSARNSTPPMDLETVSITREEAEPLLRNYDGLICTYDNMAYCLIRHGAALGIRVPEDVLVASGDDTAWCSKFGYRITTLSPMSEEIAARAFEILNAGGIHHEKIIPELIERDSSHR